MHAVSGAGDLKTGCGGRCDDFVYSLTHRHIFPGARAQIIDKLKDNGSSVTEIRAPACGAAMPVSRNSAPMEELQG